MVKGQFVSIDHIQLSGQSLGSRLFHYTIRTKQAKNGTVISNIFSFHRFAQANSIVSRQNHNTITDKRTCIHFQIHVLFMLLANRFPQPLDFTDPLLYGSQQFFDPSLCDYLQPKVTPHIRGADTGKDPWEHRFVLFRKFENVPCIYSVISLYKILCIQRASCAYHYEPFG